MISCLQFSNEARLCQMIANRQEMLVAVITLQLTFLSLVLQQKFTEICLPFWKI